MQNGLTFHLIPILSLCMIFGVYVPNFMYVDTLVLSSLGKNKNRKCCKLEVMFAKLFPCSNEYTAHRVYDDACMTLMVLWILARGMEKSEFKNVIQCKFTSKDKQKMMFFCTDLRTYATRHLIPCKIEFDSRFKAQRMAKVTQMLECSIMSMGQITLPSKLKKVIREKCMEKSREQDQGGGHYIL